ncbi:MAG: LemA family protein [Clostridiales bacterium]|nr:LemA family protein [Clostridiales bacterium]
MTVLIILIVIIVAVAAYVGGAYNSLVKSRNSVEEAFATMDVYLKKRWDLIPNIVAGVKGYAKHEAETLEKVIAARNSRYTDLSADEKIAADKELSGAVANIFALSERYPELKANQNFLDLNRQLSQVENDIANARKYYNALVKAYNTKIEIFPSNIVASIFKFTKKQMFAVENEAEKEAVKVEF